MKCLKVILFFILFNVIDNVLSFENVTTTPFVTDSEFQSAINKNLMDFVVLKKVEFNVQIGPIKYNGPGHNEFTYDYIYKLETNVIDAIQFLDNINKNKSNIIIISDFNEILNEKELSKYKSIQKEKDAGIYLLNWAKGTSNNNSQTIFKIIESVSDSIASLLVNCNNLDEMHFVGLGMGAHLAGFVGRAIQAESNNTKIVGRITGLDPTFGGSYHVLYLIRDPLNEHDAKFVDIIHTSYRYSSDLASGTVNFWPNNFNHSAETVERGLNRHGYPNYVLITYGQPGCTTDNLNCCHKIANDYWLESLNNKIAFPAVSANVFYNKQTEDMYLLRFNFVDTNYMGYHARPSYEKNYYLRTSIDPSKYSLGQLGTYSIKSLV